MLAPSGMLIPDILLMEGTNRRSLGKVDDVQAVKVASCQRLLIDQCL